jgi:hypothetical protein
MRTPIEEMVASTAESSLSRGSWISLLKAEETVEWNLPIEETSILEKGRGRTVAFALRNS